MELNKEIILLFILVYTHGFLLGVLAKKLWGKS